MNRSGVQRLSECYRLLDQSGNVEASLARYPDLADEVRAYAAVRRFVLDRLPAGPEPRALAAGRALLSAAAFRRAGPQVLPRLSPRRLAAGLAALALVGGAAVAAAATGGVGIPGPLDRILAELGITDRGTGSGGPGATDESQDTSGSQETNGAAAATTATTPGTGAGAADATAATTPGTHGDAVSDAVHTAIAGTSPGPGRGEAVSDAACAAAHDRSTLPEGAQDAAGQADRTPHPCEDDSEPDATSTPTPPPALAPDTTGSERNDQGPDHGPQRK